MTAALENSYAGKPAPTFPLTRAPAPNGQSSESDMELVNKVRRLFNDARTHRRQMVQKWVDNYVMLRNRTRPVSWPQQIPFPEIPEIWPIVESLTGWLTDQRPNIDVAPAADPYSPFYHYMTTLSDDLHLTMEANWQLNDHEAQTEMVCRDAFIYGTGIYKTHWDNSRVNGLGDAIVRRVDPFAFYPDPAATSIEDGNYFIEARRVSLEELDRRFPGAYELFESGTYDEDLDDRPNIDSATRAPKASPGPISPSTSPRYGLPGQGRSGYNYQKEGVTVLEAWIREHDVTNKKIRDKWRCVVIAGPRVLLNKPATELWSHGMHPYDRQVLSENGEFWGVSMVELLSGAQKHINRLLSALQHSAELTGNPPFVEDTRSGLQRTKINPRPGQRLTVNAGSQVQYLQAPQMSADVQNLIKFYLDEMERVSGLSAINRGMAPGGRNAASVIDSMQEASFVRVRMASRQLERTLRSVGEKLASLIVEYYDKPRFIAFLGPTGQRTALAVKSRHFYTPTGDDDNPSLPMKFSLIIHAGSMLPTSRQARVAEADTIFALGGIDLRTLLEAHDFPNREQVYQRVMEERQAGIEPPGARQRAQH